MSSGYTTRNDQALTPYPVQVVGGSDTPITKNFRISADDSTNIRIRVTAENTAAAVLKLQTSPNNGATWEDGPFVALPDGDTTLKASALINSATTPLWPLARLVIETGDADITEINITSRP
jgi:hypothetical protein